MAEAPSIAVVGSVNLDLVVRTELLPSPGETIGGGVFSALPGGKGANVALAAQRLGGAVELWASVGADAHADAALAMLAADGVGLEHVARREDHPTGIALINVSASGENQIAVAPGANALFAPDDLAGLQSDAIISQFEVPLEVIERAFSVSDGFTCLNASPAGPPLGALLPETDLVIVNETEYAHYRGQLDGFAGLIAITLGADGAILRRSGEEIARANPPAVDVVDTTGAGDAFAAALTIALVEGQSSEEALRFACAAGALAATRHGAQTASPTRAEVAALLAQ